MPERRDYLLRMMEQMSRVLARIRERIAGGEVAAARDELRTVVRQAGLELDMATRMSSETLLSLLSLGSSPDPARCLLVAEVLKADAEILDATGATDAADRLRAKAEILYRAVGGVNDETTG